MNVHIFKSKNSRDHEAIQSVNSIVYSELTCLEEELHGGRYGVKLPLIGNETYIIDGHKFDVKNKHYLLTNPWGKTEAILKSPTPIKGICIGLTENFLLRLCSEIQQDTNAILAQKNTKAIGLNLLNHCYSINRNNALASFLQSIKYQWAKYKHLDHFEERQFYYDLGELIIKDQVEFITAIDRLEQSRLVTKSEIYRRVDNMNQFIHDNFQENISLEALAKIACLSKYHAIRCFQKINGISPYQKITALRIEKAKSLLKKGYAVNETALLCGFTDYRAFSKQFKKRTGIAPSLFGQQ